MSGVLAPSPLFQSFTANGLPNSFGTLATYAAGTSTPQATYTDATLSQANQNPLTLNALGQAAVWLAPGLGYKFVWFDQFGNQLGSSDQITIAFGAGSSLIPSVANTYNIGSASLTWANGYFGTAVYVGGIPVVTYVRTPAEISANVTPSNYNYPAGDLRRYGAVGGPAGSLPSMDDSAAWASAVSTGNVLIPQGWAFKVVTGANFTGQITVQGQGQSSQVYCDTALLTVTSGNSSIVDNVWLGNITVPYTIARNPANWSAALTPAQSNGLGYQPTSNDPEYSTWVSAQPLVGTQNIGPVVTFTGAASVIKVSRIYGRFVRITIQDAVNSTVEDCDFQGGKGLFSAILFDNCSNNIQRGVANKAINNRVYYASYSGIAMISNDHFIMQGNHCFQCGESGTQTVQSAGFILTTSPASSTTATLTAPYGGPTASVYGVEFDDGEIRNNVTFTNGSATISWSGALGTTPGIQISAWGNSALFNFSTTDPACFLGQIIGNHCYYNYYDGLDCLSTFGATVGAARTYHLISDNYSFQNHGVGLSTDGQFNNLTGNTIYFNYSYGIWGTCQYCKITDNMCIDNNQARVTNVAEISATGGPANKIADNFIYGGPTQNSPGILTTASSINYISDNIGVGVTTNSVGTVGSIGAVYDSNIDNAVGLATTPQSFCFIIRNSSGVLQHAFYSDYSQAAGGRSDRVIGATSGGFTNTPTGADSSTAFAAGAKVGSATPSIVWMNTAAQFPSNVLMNAVIVASNAGVALSVAAMFESININGVTQSRLCMQFSAPVAGTPYSLSTLTTGQLIAVQFNGKLA